MSFRIERSFGASYKGLLQRPRISHKVSEYVVDFINENFLKPKRVLQSDKYIYVLIFSFSFSIPKARKFPKRSPYSTDTRLFFSQNGFRTYEKIEKWATIAVIADDIDQTITPFDYANVIYEIFANFLLDNYNKFDKAEFDKMQTKLNRSYIESFTFPASFEEQQYLLDDIEHPIAPLEYGYEWTGLDKLVTINPRIEYLKHYSF